MSNYIGCKCSVCEKEFTAEDDIVVCPDCGAPYHRACWDQVGHCVHRSGHRTGYVWESDRKAEEPAGRKEIICPHCHEKNDANALNCKKCGALLLGVHGAQSAPKYQPQGSSFSEEESPFSGMSVQALEITPETEISGIKAKDWASYLHRSVPYFLMQFLRIDTTKKSVTFNFSAFLFGPIYFFYRKMWRVAAIATAASIICSIPTMMEFWSLSGNPVFAGLDTSLMVMLTNFFGILDWVIRIVLALFAVYLYKKESESKIRKICSTVPEGPERTIQLSTLGGVSLPAAILAAVGTLSLLYFLLYRFSGPQLMEVLESLYG